ncbi:MAG: alpha/beta hydrolase, partial [Steroidobacteraceae bacterium]
MSVDPVLAGVLEKIHAPNATPMHEVSPERARDAYRRMTVGTRAVANALPVDGVDQMIDSPAGELHLRVYRPRDTQPGATCVFLHGGGYVIGDLDTHESISRTIAHEMNVVVVAVGYRLAPEHPFPAAYEDSLLALEWAWNARAELGGSSDLFLAGDSAGAALCLSLATSTSAVPVRAQLLLCPYLDLVATTDSRRTFSQGHLLEEATLTWFANSYAGKVGVAELAADARVRPTSDAALGRAPATLIAVAGFDPLHDEGVDLASRLDAVGVRVDLIELPDMIHGFPDFTDSSPRAAEA